MSIKERKPGLAGLGCLLRLLLWLLLTVDIVGRYGIDYQVSPVQSRTGQESPLLLTVFVEMR